jgi:hypothetical protein
MVQKAMADTGETLNNMSLAAAMAHSYARDQEGFAGLVAILLENSLPTHVQVERKPVHLFSSEKRVARVRVGFGDEMFELIDPGGNRQLIATKIKVVRGITLKNEEISVGQWLKDLEAAIQEYASGNEYAATAIAEWLKNHGV